MKYFFRILKLSKKFNEILPGCIEKLLHYMGIIKMDRSCTPDFLCIGAAKSATSWLHINLCKHQDIFLHKKKEPHFFSSRFCFDSFDDYLKEFKGQENKVKGEMSTTYATISDWRKKIIHRMNPDLKIVYMLRNPIDRAWSHVVMDLITIPGKRPEDVTNKELYDHLKKKQIIQHGLYLSNMERWKKYFPEKNILVVFHSDAKNNPKDLLSSVFSFLGVDIDVDWTKLPYKERIGPKGTGLNPKVKMDQNSRKYLQVVYASSMADLKKKYPDKADLWSMD